MNPLAIDAPYDGALQFIHNLVPYATWVGTDEMLDLWREIFTSGNYYWQGVAIPTCDNTLIPPLQTLNGTVQVPTGSYITGITAYVNSELTGEGYKVRLYDEGTKASIFYGDYALERVFASTMQLHYGQGSNNPPSDPGSNLDNPFGPNLLMSPFIVTNPGIIGWEIVNLSPLAAGQQIQIMLSVAVPANKRSVGQMVVEKQYGQ
jgi:hypothetical protein